VRPKPPTKQEIRDKMNREINRFLNKGGTVNDIPSGVSGRETVNGVPKSDTVLFNDPKAPKREYLTEVIHTVEERKKPEQKTKAKPPSGEPKRVPVYDDFGEIIRYDWQ